MSNKATEEQIALDILRVSHEAGVTVDRMTYAQYKKWGKYSYRTLQSLGGFQSIRRGYFDYIYDKDIQLVYAKRAKANYIRRLEAKVAAQEYIAQEFSANVRDALSRYPMKVVSPTRPHRKHTTGNMAMVAVLSDTHFGLDITKSETGVNAYNWVIAGRRIAKYTTAILAEAATQGIRELHLCVGGDIAQGMVYREDKGTNAIVTQALGAAHIITNMIEQCTNHFTKVYVHCTPGNHMRLASKGRDGLISQKWDSFATLFHIILAAYFRSDFRVKFNVPLTPYTTFDVLGHTMFLTHGDSVLNIPYPSKVLPLEKIDAEKHRLVSSGIVDSLGAIIIGHFHNPVCMTLSTGGALIINGTGSGVDNYAMAKGYSYNNPTQVFFTVTEEAVTKAMYPVKLANADDNEAYDEVIPVFEASILGPNKLLL